jgi:hypothetical protein
VPVRSRTSCCSKSIEVPHSGQELAIGVRIGTRRTTLRPPSVGFIKNGTVRGRFSHDAVPHGPPTFALVDGGRPRPGGVPSTSDRLLRFPRSEVADGVGPGRRCVDRGRRPRGRSRPHRHRRAALPTAGPPDDRRPNRSPLPGVRPNASSARGPVLSPHARPDEDVDRAGDAPSRPIRGARLPGRGRIPGRGAGPPRDPAEAGGSAGAPVPTAPPRPGRRARATSAHARRAGRGDARVGRTRPLAGAGDADRGPDGRRHAPSATSARRRKRVENQGGGVLGPGLENPSNRPDYGARQAGLTSRVFEGESIGRLGGREHQRTGCRSARRERPAGMRL